MSPTHRVVVVCVIWATMAAMVAAMACNYHGASGMFATLGLALIGLAVGAGLTGNILDPIPKGRGEDQE